MCEPWEPPDGGWDTQVPGGRVIIVKIPDSMDDWFPNDEGDRP